MKIITTVNVRINNHKLAAGTQIELEDSKAQAMIDAGQATKAAEKVPKDIAAAIKDRDAAVALNKSYEAQIEELRDQIKALSAPEDQTAGYDAHGIRTHIMSEGGKSYDAFLIEAKMDGRTCYFALDDQWNAVWVESADGAVHFARRSDAERMMDDASDTLDFKITDHRWVDGVARDRAVVIDDEFTEDEGESAVTDPPAEPDATVSDKEKNAEA